MSGPLKTLISGVKPTGRPHIGNYFGAMRQFADLQASHRTFIFVADYHALTTLQNPEEMRRGIRDVVLDYLAIGLDPEEVTLFKQSDVPEHTELAWIFNCITTMPYLMRAHAFKDAEAKNKEISVGTFDYPMLMAADILIYDADVVPVGQDQKQHIEFARDTAEKFNRLFGETFKLPHPLILEATGIVPGLDGAKMSKSHKNTIPLFASPEEIHDLVMGITTDSKSVEEGKDPADTIGKLLSLVMGEGEFKEFSASYTKGGVGYADAKRLLAERLSAYLLPLRERRAEYAAKEELVEEVLERGKTGAREIAARKLDLVRKSIGTTL